MSDPHSTSPSGSFRAAVIGVNWGIRMHVPALRAAGFAVERLIGRRPARTEAAARELGIPKFGCERQALWNDDVDLVAIAVPWQSHFEIYAEAAEACRAALLLEHPLSPLPTEARELGHAMRARSAPCFLNFPTRFFSVANQVRERLRSGELGTRLHVEHQFLYPFEEQREWLPLLASHSLDYANELLTLDRLLQPQWDRREMVAPESCPSWSAPLCTHTADQKRAFVAESVRLEFLLPAGGHYSLLVGHGPEPDFVERFAVCGETRAIGYESRLHREDEHSPWRLSELWEGKPEDVHEIPRAEQIPSGGDPWYLAHVQQAKRIRDRLLGHETSPPPSTSEDALRVQEFLVEALERLH